MFITVTKFRPDYTPIKQVVIDFEDDALFDAEEDEFFDEEFAFDEDEQDENELDGQTSIEDLINMLACEEDKAGGRRGTWTISFKN